MCLGSSVSCLTFSYLGVYNAQQSVCSVLLHMPLLISPLTNTKAWKCLNAHSLQWVPGLFLWGFHEYCPTKHVHTGPCGFSDYKSICVADLWLGEPNWSISCLVFRKAVLVLTLSRLCGFYFSPNGERHMFNMFLHVQIVTHGASCGYHPRRYWHKICFSWMEGSTWLRIPALR